MKAIGIKDLMHLPVRERLRLVEDLWDSIAETPDQIGFSPEQTEELDRRLQAYLQDPEAGSPWPEVKKRILKKE
ncbi:MAG TPA: addiction module protein [Thiotrichales bacterium]|nr:addiction module protein [Thiotrichales bacterium]